MISGKKIRAALLASTLICAPVAGFAQAFSSGGATPVIAHADATAQAANIGATTLYAVPAGGAGTYRISCYTVITQAATSSSTLPNCTVVWADKDSGQVLPASPNITAQITTNTVSTPGISTSVFGSVVAEVAASSNIQYGALGYASSGVTPMQYAIHVKLEYLGP